MLQSENNVCCGQSNQNVRHAFFLYCIFALNEKKKKITLAVELDDRILLLINKCAAISGATNQVQVNPMFTRPTNYLAEH